MPNRVDQRLADLGTGPGSTADAPKNIAASVSELLGDLVGRASGNVADAVSAVVEEGTHAVTQTVGDMVDSLLATGGMLKPVKEVLEHTAHVVAKLTHTLGAMLGALLGEGGTQGPIDHVLKQTGGEVANLTHQLAPTLSGAVDVLLLGRGDVPAPASNPVIRPPASPWYSWQVDGIGERVGAEAGGLARAVGERVGDGGSRVIPEPSPTHVPSAPGTPPPFVPVAPPGGPATVGYSSYLGTSGSSADAAQMLFVLAVLLAVLLQGGTLTWHRREPHRLHSALRLAVERPG